MTTMNAKNKLKKLREKLQKRKATGVTR